MVSPGSGVGFFSGRRERDHGAKRGRGFHVLRGEKFSSQLSLGLVGCGAFRILDRVQYEALRAILSCMHSTAIAVLLSQANDPPLGLYRSLLLNHFILRNMSWRNKALIPRLQQLSERSGWRRFRISPDECSFLLAYNSTLGVAKDCFRIICPSYFNYSWEELILSLSLDPEPGRGVKAVADPLSAFDELVRDHPDSVLIFTDGSRDPSIKSMRAGFFVLSQDYRFGIRLSSFTSVLSSELFFIFCAL